MPLWRSLSTSGHSVSKPCRGSVGPPFLSRAKKNSSVLGSILGVAYSRFIAILHLRFCGVFRGPGPTWAESDAHHSGRSSASASCGCRAPGSSGRSCRSICTCGRGPRCHSCCGGGPAPPRNPALRAGSGRPLASSKLCPRSRASGCSPPQGAAAGNPDATRWAAGGCR